MQIVPRTTLRQRNVAATATALLVLPTLSMAGPMPKEAGVWFDDTGKGAVKIEVCGGKLCGRIVWLKSLVNDKGEPLIDRHNPEANLRTRPICGLQVVGQLDQMPEGGYDNGWIYDPKEGKSYSVAMKLTGADELSVTGYKGVKLFSKTFVWKRAKTELPSCAAAPVETKAAPATGGAVASPAAAAVKAAPAAAAKPAAAAAPTAAPAKPQQAGTSDALPWADGKAQPPPAAKPAASGASNLGAPKPSAYQPAAQPIPAPVAKTPASAAKPQAAKPVQKTSATPALAAKPAANATVPGAVKPAVINAVPNAKPAPKKPQAPVEAVDTE